MHGVVERARAVGPLRALLAENLEDVDLLGEVARAILLLRLVRKRVVEPERVAHRRLHRLRAALIVAVECLLLRLDDCRSIGVEAAREVVESLLALPEKTRRQVKLPAAKRHVVAREEEAATPPLERLDPVVPLRSVKRLALKFVARLRIEDEI